MLYFIALLYISHAGPVWTGQPEWDLHPDCRGKRQLVEKRVPGCYTREYSKKDVEEFIESYKQDSIISKPGITDNDQCKWFGTAPWCGGDKTTNLCPDEGLVRRDCRTSAANVWEVTKWGQWEEIRSIRVDRKYTTDFGGSCWMDGWKNYCCPACVFQSGDGIGGTEVKIGSYTGNKCSQMCMDAGKGYNGATVRADGKPGCWCEKGMTDVKASSKYKTCRFPNVKSICKHDKESAETEIESEIGIVSANDRLKATNEILKDALRAVVAN